MARQAHREWLEVLRVPSAGFEMSRPVHGRRVESLEISRSSQRQNTKGLVISSRPRQRLAIRKLLASVGLGGDGSETGQFYVISGAF